MVWDQIFRKESNTHMRQLKSIVEAKGEESEKRVSNLDLELTTLKNPKP
jgi:hypothetical protein